MERIQSSPAFIDSLGAIEMERKNIVMQKQTGIIDKARSKPQPPTYFLKTTASTNSANIITKASPAENMGLILCDFAAIPPKITRGIPKKIPPRPPCNQSSLKQINIPKPGMISDTKR